MNKVCIRRGEFGYRARRRRRHVVIPHQEPATTPCTPILPAPQGDPPESPRAALRLVGVERPHLPSRALPADFLGVTNAYLIHLRALSRRP